MLGTTADIVTLFAFAVAVFTAVKVFFVNREVEKLTKSYLFDQRVSDHLSLLQETRKRILPYIKEFYTADQILIIRDIVSECRANCKNLKSKVPSGSLTSLKPLLLCCDRLLGHRESILVARKPSVGNMELRQVFAENIEIFYARIFELIREIEHTQKDKKESLK